MPNDKNTNAILSWFDALNQGDLALLDQMADALFTDDFVWHDPRIVDAGCGPELVKKFIHQVLQENSDVHVTVNDIFSIGDKTASRFSVSMTEVLSGKPVKVQLLAIDRFVGGQIAEEWQLSAAGKW